MNNLITEKKNKQQNQLLTNISKMDNKSGHKRKIFFLRVKNEDFSIGNKNVAVMTFQFFSILPQHNRFYFTMSMGFSKQFTCKEQSVH